MEDSLWRDTAFLSRPYSFKFFKGCLPQNLLSSLLKTLSQMILYNSLQVFKNLLKYLKISFKKLSADEVVFHQYCREIKDRSLENSKVYKVFNCTNVHWQLVKRTATACNSFQVQILISVIRFSVIAYCCLLSLNIYSKALLEPIYHIQQYKLDSVGKLTWKKWHK